MNLLTNYPLTNNIDRHWVATAPNCPYLAESVSFSPEPDSTELPYNGPSLSTFLLTPMNANDFNGVIEYAPTSTTPDSLKVNLVTTISMTGVSDITDIFDFTLEKLICSPILSIDKPEDDFEVQYVYRQNSGDVILNLEDFSDDNTNLNNFNIIDNAQCPCTDCTARFTEFTFRAGGSIMVDYHRELL